MAVITLVNRSGWPDWFARPVVRWVAGLAGIKEPHTLVLVGTSDRLHLAGRYYAGRRYIRVRIHRRWQPKGGFPFTTTYWRYRWAMKYPLTNRLEGFVDIVAHECFHATGGHPSKFGSDKAAMEMACESFSKATVERFRREWPTVLRPAMPDRYLNHYSCPRCQRTRDDASELQNDDRCPGCDLCCTPQLLDDVDPSEPIRVHCEVVAEVFDPAAVLAHARTKALEWGFDANWSPTPAEAVYEVVRSNDDLLDRGVQIVSHGHRILR